MAVGPSSRPRAFLDISHGAQHLGRVVFELFADKTPKTCENFLSICNGRSSALTYKRSMFHRVIDEFMIQGGDITKGDGTGGKSMWGGDFADENLQWRDLDASGLLCMANRGKDTNNSQFFVTLAECPHLNGRHTVFGRVVSGLNIVEEVGRVPVDAKDRPETDVIITHCGELERKIPSRSNTAASSESLNKISQETATGSQERGRRKRRHSTSTSRSSSAHYSHDEKRRNSPPIKKPPAKSTRRRRSDQQKDEGLRGRPRQVSGARDKTSGDDNSDAMIDSDTADSTHKHDRKRSPSPSRQGRRSRSNSGSREYRRRRSLPNHYEKWRGKRDERDDRDHERYRRDDHGYDRRRDAPRREQDGRLRDGYDRRHQEAGRLGGSFNDERSDDQPAVIFKGRGNMKYREPGRL